MTSMQHITDILKAHPLFSQCSNALLDTAADGCRLSDFASGEVIKSYDDTPILCIIVKGEVLVHGKEGAADLLLRILRPGDTFGVASLLGQHGGDPVTRVTASTPTQALCMSEETLRSLLLSDSALAMRYIDFLADRIRFLNRRISCLGAGSAEKRLCAWLDSVIPEGMDSWDHTLRLSMSRLADVLGLGRASLYRALDTLSEQGLISREGKVIRIPDRAALRAFAEH